jgi:hypothetical protein
MRHIASKHILLRKFYITFFLYVEEILSQPFCGTTSLLLPLHSDWMIVVV